MRRGWAVLAGLVLAGTTTTAWAQSGGSDTDVPGLEWPLQTFGVGQIRQLPGGHGTGVIVAVVDSGVDASQPDLTGALVQGADFSSGQPLDAPGSATSDMDTKDAHGTAMASIIAGRSHQDNGQVAGMIGLADQAKIMPVRVGSGQGSGDQDQAIANGIIWAAQHGARVINLSIGSPGEGAVLQPAIRQAEDDNVVLVAGAGNDGDNGNPVEYPAAFPGVVAVSGTEPNGSMWSGSETGSYVVLAGPGDQVETAGTDGYYSASGTSDAAAYVSAEAALIIAAHPGWSAGQVIRAMISTATPGPGQAAGTRSDQYGYGIMNPYGALKAPTPSQTTNPLLAASTNTQPVTNPPASGPTQNSAVSGGGQPTPPPAATSGGGTSSNTGLIIGGVAGGVVLLAIIITLIAVDSTRRRRNTMPTGAAGFGPPGPGPGMPYQGPNPGPGPNQPPPGGYPTGRR
jgi:subtilisin family serine protease